VHLGQGYPPDDLGEMPLGVHAFNDGAAALQVADDASRLVVGTKHRHRVDGLQYLRVRLLEGLAGFEYNAGCWALRVVALRVQAAANISTTAFVFQIEFNGVGSIGTSEASDMLKRQVPGYSVSNPADARLTPPSAQPRLPYEQTF